MESEVKWLFIINILSLFIVIVMAFKTYWKVEELEKKQKK